MKVFDRVKEIILEQMHQLHKEQVVPEAELIRDLGADSLDIVQIVFEVEYAFDIEVDEGAIGQLKTVQDICDYILRTKGTRS